MEKSAKENDSFHLLLLLLLLPVPLGGYSIEIRKLC